MRLRTTRVSRPAVRILGNDDLDQVTELLMRSPLENLFVASRVQAGGLDPYMLGCQMVGYERKGELVSVCHAGSNLVPVAADDDAIDAFIRFLGPRRRAASIMGVAEPALKLWEGLSQSYGGQWSSVRDLRPVQPMMSMSEDSALAIDERVRPITMKDFDIYFDAAVKMYTEEVGQSPSVNGSDLSYRVYIRSLIQQGRSYAIIEDGRVVFKADIGSATADCCQVQGVWVAPSHRGRGIAAPAMAAVIRMARERWPVVTLYVNDFNAPALATYRRTGMRQVGEFATILF